jgi:hypothetical protein
MLKGLFVLGLLGTGLVFGVLSLLLLPFLLLGLVFKLVFLAVTLPLRLAGGVVFLVGKLLLFLLVLGLGIAGLVGGALLLPLVPLLLFLGLVWLVVRGGRGKPVAVPASQTTIDARPL